MDKDLVVTELQRVAKELKRRSLSRSLFDKHATIASATVEASFGTWNEAVVAAGLVPLPQGGLPKSEGRRLERLNRVSATGQDLASDDDLLDELCRVANLIGRRPSGNQVTAKGKYGPAAYLRKWGSMANAYDVAIARKR